MKTLDRFGISARRGTEISSAICFCSSCSCSCCCSCFYSSVVCCFIRGRGVGLSTSTGLRTGADKRSAEKSTRTGTETGRDPKCYVSFFRTFFIKFHDFFVESGILRKTTRSQGQGKCGYDSDIENVSTEDSNIEESEQGRSIIEQIVKQLHDLAKISHRNLKFPSPSFRAWLYHRR